MILKIKNIKKFDHMFFGELSNSDGQVSYLVFTAKRKATENVVNGANPTTKPEACPNVTRKI